MGFVGGLVGNGDGTFGLLSATVPGFLQSIQIADMNGDNLPDIVFPFQLNTKGGVGVLLNTTNSQSQQPNFQIVASGLSPTPVTAGNSATSTITVTPLHGFNGTVALSCSGLPSGASCAFNPASVSGGSGTSVLTLSTTSSLAAGSYPFTVTGTSGSMTRIGTLSLTVVSGAVTDFQISATAASPTSIAPGGSATSTVTITSLNGFNSAVALTCNSGNSNVTCSLNPSSVTPAENSNATSSLTVNATTLAAVGNYTVTLFATSGNDVHSTSVTVKVSTAAPDFSITPSSGSSTSQTISAGQTANFTLDFTSVGSFAGTVNLSCAITPVLTPAPTCTLSSSSVQISGSGTQTVTIKVGTTAPVSSGTAFRTGIPPAMQPLLWTFVLLGSGALLAGTRRCRLVLAKPVTLLIVFSMACGGSSSSTTHTTPGTPAGTYTATITATSGSTSHTMPLKVVVQ